MSIHFTQKANEKRYDQFITELTQRANPSANAIDNYAAALSKIATLRGKNDVVDTWEAKILFRAIERAEAVRGYDDLDRSRSVRSQIDARIAAYRETERTDTK